MHNAFFLLFVLLQMSFLSQATSAQSKEKSSADIAVVKASASGAHCDERNVQVTIKVTRMTLTDLEEDDELRALDIDMKLKLTTEENVPIFVVKKQFAISHYWIATSTEKLLAKNYFANADLLILPFENSINELKAEDVLALTKDSPVEVEESLRVFVRKDPKSKIDGTLVSGDYAMRIFLETWLATKDEAKKFREKMSLRGSLLTNPLISDPVAIHVE